MLRIFDNSWLPPQLYAACPRPNAPGNSIVDLAADYKLSSTLTAFSRADNLFNRQYEDPLGLLRPSFAVYAGLRMNN